MSELQVSPDGKYAVYAWTSPDRSQDGFVSSLHLLNFESPAAPPISLTGARADASGARFSNDGRFLAWIESRDDSSALRWAEISPKGLGKARDAFADADLDDFGWSPDSDKFVVVRKDPRRTPANPSDPHVVTRSVARSDGRGFLDDRRTHLWIVAREAGGPPLQITRGAWDDHSPAWSPDGRRIAFVSNRAGDPDTTDNTDLWLVPAAGGEARRLFDGPGAESAPSWSHRGDRIAFHSLRRADDYYQPQRLLVADPDAGEPRDLTGAMDAWLASDAMPAGASAPAAIWTRDDREILAHFDRRGATWIGFVDAATGATREIAGGRFVHGLTRRLPGGNGVLFTRTDPTHPPELYLLGAEGGEPVRLTRFYDRWLAERRLSAPEKIVATNSAGDDVDAWLYPPLDPPSDGKAPLVVYVHGGPQAFDGDFFDFDLENQLFPAQGWGVLRVNYRGSTSYGEKFSRSIWGDWHSREYEDLMAALDRAIETHDWIDADRLGIGGWSYGGIMTLWTVGHTERFRVGVPERLAFDYLSAFGEDQWTVWYLAELGSPIENAELYRRLSPGTYFSNIRTPLYLISNENDYNCPLPQALQLYQRLKLTGQNTELVVYPGASHSLSRPSHLADRLRRLLGWFGRHLDG